MGFGGDKDKNLVLNEKLLWMSCFTIYFSFWFGESKEYLPSIGILMWYLYYRDHEVSCQFETFCLGHKQFIILHTYSNSRATVALACSAQLLNGKSHSLKQNLMCGIKLLYSLIGGLINQVKFFCVSHWNLECYTRKN